MPAAVSLPDPIITVRQVGDVRIHTLISAFTANNIANATHIIESKNTLVLIDGQFLIPYAKHFRAYADGLGKPIDRVYLSHRHPDHWFGLCVAFADVVIYALAETRDFIRDHGEQVRQAHIPILGAGNVPDKVIVPQHVVEPGVEAIDGVTYSFDRVTDTEIDFLLTVRLPDQGVYIVQDLIYSGTHLYLTSNMEHWIRVLQRMLQSKYEIFLPGHGFVPAGKREIVENIEYLAAAQDAVNNGLKDAAFKQFMLQRYPARLCTGIFDIYIPRLFDGASDY